MFIRRETQLALMGSAIDNLPEVDKLADVVNEMLRKYFNLLKQNQGQACIIMLQKAFDFYYDEEINKYVVKHVFEKKGLLEQKIAYGVLTTFLQEEEPLEVIEKCLQYYRHEVSMSDMRMRLKAFFGNPKMAGYYSRRNETV